VAQRDDADSKLKKQNARQRWRNATTLILNSRNETHGKGGATPWLFPRHKPNKSASNLRRDTFEAFILTQR
jgi:hypothetical protein